MVDVVDAGDEYLDSCCCSLLHTIRCSCNLSCVDDPPEARVEPIAGQTWGRHQMSAVSRVDAVGTALGEQREASPSWLSSRHSARDAEETDKTRGRRRTRCVGMRALDESPVLADSVGDPQPRQRATPVCSATGCATSMCWDAGSTSDISCRRTLGYLCGETQFHKTLTSAWGLLLPQNRVETLIGSQANYEIKIPKQGHTFIR